MNTKQYLNQIRDLERSIRRKSADVFNLRTMSTSISVGFGDDKIQTSSPKDRISEAVSKIVDEESKINDLIAEYIQKRNEIIFQIESLEDEKVSELLYLRYVNCEKFERIADEMDYSWRNVMYLHDKSLSAFEKKYGFLYKK